MLAISMLNSGYRLGKNYPGIILSFTQLQIIHGLSRGKELDHVAEEIGLARRTVKCICMNLMVLMGCNDLSDLIETLRGELYHHIA